MSTYRLVAVLDDNPELGQLCCVERTPSDADVALGDTPERFVAWVPPEEIATWQSQKACA